MKVPEIMIPQADSDRTLAWALSIKAINGNFYLEFLVTYHRLRKIPAASTIYETQPHKATIKKRAHWDSIARKELESQMSRLKLKREIDHTVILASDRSYQPGDGILIYLEKTPSNRLTKWLGLYLFASVDYKRTLVFVRIIKK